MVPDKTPIAMTSSLDDGKGISARQDRLGKREKNALAIRRKLLDASRELFSEIGYQAATITKIRELAEVSIATFYKYFDSKQSVLLALVNDEHERYQQAVTSALCCDVDDPIDYLVSVVIAALDPPETMQAKALWREIVAASVLLSSQPEGVESMVSDRDLYSGHMRQAFDRLKSLNLVKPGVPVMTLSDVIYCISAHEFQDYICGRYHASTQLRQTIQAQIDVVVRPWLRR